MITLLILIRPCHNYRGTYIMQYYNYIMRARCVLLELYVPTYYNCCYYYYYDVPNTNRFSDKSLLTFTAVKCP